MINDFADYQLIVEDSELELNKKVVKRLDDGWELWGGPRVAYDPDEMTPFYAQAVVLRTA
jgi:hypothetical protein